jgi:hypothetical protein
VKQLKVFTSRVKEFTQAAARSGTFKRIEQQFLPIAGLPGFTAQVPAENIDYAILAPAWFTTCHRKD